MESICMEANRKITAKKKKKKINSQKIEKNNIT